jgi:hypothetical protein
LTPNHNNGTDQRSQITTLEAFRKVLDFYLAFSRVPFSNRTRKIVPPNEPGNIDLDDLLVPHPRAVRFSSSDENSYWNDDWWGCSPEVLRTIDLDRVDDVFFVREGVPDEDAWLAVLSVILHGEKIYLFIQANTCYTGFGVTGGVHIYVSRSLERLRTMCMSPSQEETCFG